MEINYIKIYHGSAIIVDRLAFLLDKEQIPTHIKNAKESGRLAGFGTTGDAVELFILEKDLHKAMCIVDDFDKKIQK